MRNLKWVNSKVEAKTFSEILNYDYVFAILVQGKFTKYFEALRYVFCIPSRNHVCPLLEFASSSAQIIWKIMFPGEFTEKLWHDVNAHVCAYVYALVGSM